MHSFINGWLLFLKVIGSEACEEEKEKALFYLFPNFHCTETGLI